VERSIIELHTFRLDLEYDGSEFQGWQLQPNVRTVQGSIEQALATLFGEAVIVHGAGRTDAGVHALGQVAHFRTSLSRSPSTILRALNALLPDDIRIRDVSIASSDFHARFSARWRAYRYRIALRPIALMRHTAWWHSKHLEICPMQDAADYILGDHCFRTFAHHNELEKHYLSTCYRAEWREQGPYLDFYIEANRFLHGMVRFLVGTIVDIGRGKIDVEIFRKMLAAEDVALAGPKAPARGLTLMSVGYKPWQAGKTDGNWYGE
jgi:tRNA pseudouridine38-40 synthase